MLAPDSKLVRLAKFLYDFFEMIIIAATITIVTFMFIGRLTVVDGPSMMNTLIDKETLFVSNFAYTPKQGDIVVFQQPNSHINEPIVKRVIATEGQVVDIDFDNWIVYVDGKPLFIDNNGDPMIEPYINYKDGYRMNEYDVDFPITVPEGEVFLMGDNRNHSNDSRSSDIGTVDKRYIFGRVICRIRPFSKFGPVN
ncbi:MAG: signal peptidase I [Ruminococcaceae bacterium]|nr:signal peptidase I [Oscillospiraceae bacterium]